VLTGLQQSIYSCPESVKRSRVSAECWTGRASGKEDLLRTVLRLVLMHLLALTSVTTGCMKSGPMVDTSTESVRIEDWVYYHNVSIAYDGKHYFTINGGNDGYCMINEYTRDGKLIEKYNVGLDGRAIFYSPGDRALYVKDYGFDLYRFDPGNAEVQVELSEVFYDENSSPGMSPDGKFFFEQVGGEVFVYDVKTGEEVRTIEIAEYFDEHGYSTSIAASNRHLFVWGDHFDVLVYDMNGKFVSRYKLPKLGVKDGEDKGGFGYSLSYCRGMLWIADDADAMDVGGEGYWIGYTVRD